MLGSGTLDVFHHLWQVQYRKLFLMILVLGIGGTHLGGFQMSVINYTSPYIQKFINETWLERYGSALHQETLTLFWSLIVSTYCIGGMIGCLCSGYLTTKYGKKKCLLINDVVLIIATLNTGFSRRAKSFEMILIGRFLEGICAGVYMNAHIQYAGEISPKKLRGFVNVTSSVFLALGKAVARVLGLRYLYKDGCLKGKEKFLIPNLLDCNSWEIELNRGNCFFTGQLQISS
uniref:Major facilitator superfamily (MFS) profile domain-containing protein n=1 Tax=Coturnix japonica TaxID=93934 RepID=A0A8C2TD92_COTJA